MGLFQSLALADTIHENIIFSESVYSGAALCSDIEAGGYCETAITHYDSEGKRVKIRTFYFPAFDNKQRINYWYLPQSC